MTNHTFVHFLRFAAVAVSLLFIQGCASPNGYISSFITTGIGIDISENPQTQVPHLRLGYIRNGMYYIPTGKYGDPNGDPSKTPHVVSKIHVSTGMGGTTISEKFAVGDKAGNSTAAAALFADTSTEGIHTPANSDSSANSAAITAAVKAQRLKDAADVGTARIIRDQHRLDEARKARAEQKAKETEINAWNQAIGKLEDTAPMWRDKNSADEAKMKLIFKALLAEEVLSDANLSTTSKTDLDTVSDFFEKKATRDQRQKLLLAARSQAAKIK